MSVIEYNIQRMPYVNTYVPGRAYMWHICGI